MRVRASHGRVATYKSLEIGGTCANEPEGAVVRLKKLLERAMKHRVEYAQALWVEIQLFKRLVCAQAPDEWAERFRRPAES
jgi:hypothetical protein